MAKQKAQQLKASEEWEFVDMPRGVIRPLLHGDVEGWEERDVWFIIIDDNVSYYIMFYTWTNIKKTNHSISKYMKF